MTTFTTKITHYDKLNLYNFKFLYKIDNCEASFYHPRIC